ncbi:retrotransposon protein, putative, ty1-copia subclass [Tanacetum coccineum]
MLYTRDCSASTIHFSSTLAHIQIVESVAPTVYKKAKQAPEEKREALLIKELQQLLSKEDLSTNPSEKAVKKKKTEQRISACVEKLQVSSLLTLLYGLLGYYDEEISRVMEFGEVRFVNKRNSGMIDITPEAGGLNLTLWSEWTALYMLILSNACGWWIVLLVFKKQAAWENLDLIQSFFHGAVANKGGGEYSIAKDDAYHHCKEVGHWKRNCPVYLAELQKKRKQVGSASSSGIPKETMGFTISTPFYFPPENKNCFARSARTHRAPDHLCLNVEVEEHSLGDFNEPNNYKAAILDSESVAKGYTQTYGVDYKETFSPVADIRAIWILIAITAFYDYEIWQMDVKTAFLNGYLNEDIYMVQPKGFVDPNHPRKVCKLQRSIYGLKQASRSWNKRFDEEIKRFGFAQNLDEPCVYQKASGSNVTFLILYVDDIIIMGNHISSLQSVKSYLGKCFAMKDLGEATFILGIKIYRDRSKRLIGLSQSAYMDKILKRFRMDTSKRGYIPMQERLDLNKTQGASTPEENPGECHWTAVKNILKYLRNTKDMFLVYGGNPEAEL